MNSKKKAREKLNIIKFVFKDEPREVLGVVRESIWNSSILDIFVFPSGKVYRIHEKDLLNIGESDVEATDEWEDEVKDDIIYRLGFRVLP